MTYVVIYDNIIRDSDEYKNKNPADFLDQFSPKSLHWLSYRSVGNYSFRADHCREGRKADIAKPMKGLGSGVFEVACRIGEMLSGLFMPCRSRMKSGSFMPSRRNRPLESKTPKQEIDLVKDRLKRLKEMLK